jgi:hypothetical protein
MEFSKTCSTQFLANVVRILPKKLLFLCPVALLSLSVPLLVASSAKAETYTSVVCYFEGNNKWQWGLVRNNNSYYQLHGDWKDSRFETSVSRDEIIESCSASKAYYKMGNLVNIYAADKATGSNYDIYSNNQIVKP